MTEKTVKLPQPADPTIDQVLEQFLTEQRARLKPRTVSRYEDVLDLLRHHLNGYAYEALSDAESALFDRHHNADGDERREFCDLFGPDKILENLGSFLGYFMIRKVVAGEELKRAAGTVTKKLSKWLSTKGYVSEEEAQIGADEGAEAARDLPKAERAAQILADAVADLTINPNDLADEDYIEFDHFTIGRIEPGKLWLEVFESGETRLYGPVVHSKNSMRGCPSLQSGAARTARAPMHLRFFENSARHRSELRRFGVHGRSAAVGDRDH